MSHRNLPRLAISFVILATILTAGVSAFNRTCAVVLPKPAPKPALGINLSGPSDWNTELPLCDVFRFSRTWISQRHGSAWGKGPALPFDKNGYVTALEPDCFAETPLCTIEDGHYPTGIYTVIYEGTGTIEFSKGRVLSTRPGRIEVEIDSAKGGFFLRLKSTMPKGSRAQYSGLSAWHREIGPIQPLATSLSQAVGGYGLHSVHGFADDQ